MWRFFVWQDVVEIIFFSSLIYYFSCWLKKDRQKNLLFPFYGYCIVTFAAYFTQLTTISYFLFLFAPVAIMLFILFHQEQLQKNFVSLRNITPARLEHTQWPDTLLRSCLVAMSKNKEISCVIEKKDSLINMINSPFMLYANLENNLLTLLLDSAAYDQSKMIWINTKGQLLSINAIWHNDINRQWLSEEVKELHTWQQNALFVTTKTDALVFRITPASNRFDVVVQGQVIENLTASATLRLLKQYSWHKDYRVKKGNVEHEHTFEDHHLEQRAP